jgi:hypothetical protein
VGAAGENDDILLKLLNNTDEQSNTSFHYNDKQVVALFLTT